MADRVPAVGPWQSDPVIREFITWLRSQPNAPRGSVAAADPARQSRVLAYQRYIDANRQRLGIPDNYTPDPRTNGQTLYDPNQNQLRDALLTGGAMAAGGYALGSALGAGASSAASSVPELGNVNGTIDSLMAAGGNGAQSGLAALATPSGLARAAATGVPALLSAFRGGGGSGPFGDGQDEIVDEIRQSIAAQRDRFNATQPAFETAQRMAVGMAPTRYRSSGPFGGGR